MPARPANILLVEADDDLAELLADHLERSTRSVVTRVCTASEAAASHMTENHDVALVDMPLPDCDDLGLVQELRASGDCEVVLLTGEPTLGCALAAMRLGVRDMFGKPFDLGHLTRSVEQAVDVRRRRDRERLRYDRLRRVSSRIIRERRVLRQRIDLVCRDLVGAYRRLAKKFVAQRQTTD